MPVQRLRKLLDENDVKYVILSHSPAYTAQEVAQSAHISGREMAKTVVVNIDGRMTLAVLPASGTVDFEKLRALDDVNEVYLASEDEFRDRFGNAETGAMPPFGNLYDLETLVDPSLAGDEEIAFSAGSHTELVKMPYADFERLARPRIVEFT